MDKSTLEKAMNIKCEIEKLNKENDALLRSWKFWNLFVKSFKNKLFSGHPKYVEITLTEEDVEMLIKLRENRIEELQKELEQL